MGLRYLPCSFCVQCCRITSMRTLQTHESVFITFRKASFCSRCLLIIGVTWSVSELGPSLSAPPHQSSSLLYSCSRLSKTLQTYEKEKGQVINIKTTSIHLPPAAQIWQLPQKSYCKHLVRWQTLHIWLPSALHPIHSMRTDDPSIFKAQIW